MLALLDKYASSLDVHAPTSGTSLLPGHVVVITGATGSLGAHIANQLLQHKDTRKLVCLVRASDNATAMKRVLASFKERMLDTSILNGDRVVALKSDLDEDKLGLDDAVYSSLKREATVIIHVSISYEFQVYRLTDMLTECVVCKLQSGRRVI